MAEFDPETTERLLAAGWIARAGNHLVITDKGRAAMRRGFVGGVVGARTVAVDSVRARTRLSIAKKKHRKG